MTVNKAYKFRLYSSEYKDKVYENIKVDLNRNLNYKCKWSNKELVSVSPYYASSQICSQCGHKDKSMKDLNKRKYHCKECGNKIDRDINASLNLIYEGIKLLIKSNRIIQV